MSRPSHDELAHDLAESRRSCGEIVAERLGLGAWGGSAQLDVAAMRPSWANPNPTAYEVKVSRSDFMADTQTGKYTKYLPYVRRLYFAVPAGLIGRDEVPEGTGLIVRGEKGWSVVRAPRVGQVETAKWPVFLQALLMKAHGGPWSGPRTRAERIAAIEEARDLGIRSDLLGRRVWEALTRAEQLEERTAARLDRLRWSLAGALGEPAGDRTLEQLAESVLERRPARPAPHMRTLVRELESVGRQIEVALAAAQRIAGAEGLR